MEETFRWDDDSYRRIAAAGIPWQTVSTALHTRPRIRKHVGGDLAIAAPATDWVTHETVWVAVALIEEADDQYLVYDARLLTADEAEVCRKMIKGELP